jgi:hypothetical protein
MHLAMGTLCNKWMRAHNDAVSEEGLQTIHPVLCITNPGCLVKVVVGAIVKPIEDVLQAESDMLIIFV